MKAVINEKFKNIIPPLSTEEYESLEKNCIKDGIRDALVLWEDTILDGHNRYEISKKHNLEFITEQMSFETDEEAEEWIIENQFGRRNINKYQRAVLALRLEDLFKEKGKQKQRDSGGSVPQKSAKPPIDTRKEIAKEAKVSHDTIAKVKKIQEEAPEEIKQGLTKGKISIDHAYKEIQKTQNKEKLKKKQDEYQERVGGKSESIDILTTDKTYRIFYIDPPWGYNDKQETPMLGGAKKHYDSMTIKELCDFPIPRIADADAVMYLWVTSPLLEDAFKIIKSWGFKYKTSFVWDKVKHNMGHYNSVRHEFLLICTKGSCTPDEKKLFDSVQTIERTKNHSEKPEEFREIIDTNYTHGNRLEVFARIKNKGWDFYGNEL
jgi:N6-adenosine-specific RNA methylase IME4